MAWFLDTGSRSFSHHRQRLAVSWPSASDFTDFSWNRDANIGVYLIGEEKKHETNPEYMIQPSNPTKIVMFHRISSHVDQVNIRIEFIQLCPQVGNYEAIWGYWNFHGWRWKQCWNPQNMDPKGRNTPWAMGFVLCLLRLGIFVLMPGGPSLHGIAKHQQKHIQLDFFPE